MAKQRKLETQDMTVQQYRQQFCTKLTPDQLASNLGASAFGAADDTRTILTVNLGDCTVIQKRLLSPGQTLEQLLEQEKAQAEAQSLPPAPLAAADSKPAFLSQTSDGKPI